MAGREAVDLLIRGGLVVDGTGAPAFVGDVAVRGDRIVAIGASLEKTYAGVEEVDATGKVVTPGWVDVHTHLDAEFSFNASLEPFASNGVTTVVAGNCGVGFAPCRPQQRSFLMELMEGVEDIPLGSLDAGIDWQWETFPEFLEFLDRTPLGVDVAVMIGHGPVRAFVMGERANLADRPGGPERDPVTPEEIAGMAAIVQEAVAAGAIGFSTSRTLLHRDKSGALVPGTLATQAELLAIGEAMAKGGGGVLEMASDFWSYDDKAFTDEDLAYRLEVFMEEWAWMNAVSKGCALPVCFCLGMPSEEGPRQNFFRRMLTTAEESQADGANIFVQVFVRPQGIQMVWDSKSHPFVEAASFVALKREALRSGSPGGLDKKALAEPATRAAIVAETLALAEAAAGSEFWGIALPQSTESDEDMLAGNLNGAVGSVGALAKMMLDGARFIYRWDATYEPTFEDSALFHAEEQGVSPLHVIYDWLCLDEGTKVVSFLFMNYSKCNLDDTFEMLTHPATIPGLGDAGAHLGFLVDSTSHSYLLTHWVRDKQTRFKLALEQAVKMHTHDTAQAFGLTDRGVLQAGMKADINVIDLDQLTIHAPKMVHDLPKGASRWVQLASGYAATVLSGVVTHRDDAPVPGQQLQGRLVRNPGTFATRGSDLAVSLGLADAPPLPQESLTGRVATMLAGFKWDTKAKMVGLLARVFGGANLESIGQILAKTPLSHVAKL